MQDSFWSVLEACQHDPTMACLVTPTELKSFFKQAGEDRKGLKPNHLSLLSYTLHHYPILTPRGLVQGVESLENSGFSD